MLSYNIELRFWVAVICIAYDPNYCKGEEKDFGKRTQQGRA